MSDQVCCSLGFTYLPVEESPKIEFITCEPIPIWCMTCFPKPKEFTQIPLYRRHLKANFREADLVITERQDYLHRFNDEVEAEFRFPAKMVSLFEFQYQIDDDEWVDMKVEEKREAERKYQDAINKGHQAVLAKQDNDKIYTVKVGRLKPNQKISIRFSYYSTYEITSESLSYTFPLTAMPPYVRPGDSTEGLPKWNSPSFWNDAKNLPYGITLDATFDRNVPFSVNYISDKVMPFESTGNTLKIPRQTLDGKRNVTFQVKPKEGFNSKAFEWTSAEGQKYFQVCLANYFKSTEPVPLPTADQFDPKVDGDWEVIEENEESCKVERRVLFIGDGSGSMGGDPIKDLKNAMELALKDQPQTAKFSVAMFGSDFKFYPEAKRLTSSVSNYYQKPTSTIVSGQAIHIGFQCDGCQSMPIVGDRHKCEGCPDFDLCDKCFNLNKLNNFHFKDHLFTTITGKQENALNSNVKKTEIQTEIQTEDVFWLEQNDDNIASAFKWLENNINASYGGTEMFKVLNEGYSRLLTTRKEGVKYQDMILFMTDGDVYGQQTSQITELVKKHADTVTCFSMGIGHSHSSELVESIAKAGNGYCSHVYFSEDVPEKVQMTMRCLTSAHLRNAYLKWNDCNVQTTSVRPTSLLFENEPHYVWAKVKSVGENPSVTLMTTYNGKNKVVTTVSLKELSKSSFALDQSFAMTQIKEWLNTPLTNMSKIEKSAKITPLAIKFNVITPYTAAIGITKSDQPNDNPNKIRRIEIPIATPERGQKTIDYNSVAMVKSAGFFSSSNSGLTRCSTMMGSVEDYPEEDCSYEGFDCFNTFDSKPVPISMMYSEERCRNPVPVISVNKTRSRSGKHSRSIGGLATSGNVFPSAAGFSYSSNPNLNTKSDLSITKSDLSIMEDLIKLQSLNGSWSKDAIVSSGLNWYLEETLKIDEDLVPTFQVLAFFHRLMEHNSRWNYSYNKGFKWLIRHDKSKSNQTSFLQMAGNMFQKISPQVSENKTSTTLFTDV